MIDGIPLSDLTAPAVLLTAVPPAGSTFAYLSARPVS